MADEKIKKRARAGKTLLPRGLAGDIHDKSRLGGQRAGFCNAQNETATLDCVAVIFEKALDAPLWRALL
ncbi:hypothetical protein [Ralstonia mannitolilytica]|uniref:hypothetical protein n=1 Tax=Ralstonia mannitolilytica TaxID=105219 RepID=UPI00142555A5|nr:hypothetical protein [Ralstonia mannitolilytica]MBY4718443.1 hypothetical protein [Ralstonia mannitolilytica]